MEWIDLLLGVVLVVYAFRTYWITCSIIKKFRDGLKEKRRKNHLLVLDIWK
jgi:hypothetical protein